MTKPNNTGITAERLKELIHYDGEAGVFTRITHVCGRAKVGDVAGTLNHGYLQICIDYKYYRAHRLAWLYTHGRWPVAYIDHINGNRSDNRLCNLREANRSENNQNVRKSQSNSATKLLGSSFHKNSGSFTARIQINHKLICLGYYPTALEAHQAYLAAKRLHHPFSTL